MKLLFVGNTAWSMWNFRKEVMLALQEDGHQVILVAPYDLSVEKIQKHITVEMITSLNRKGKNFYQDFLLFIELIFIYKKYKPDLVFHYTIKPNIYGSFAAFFCGVRSYMMVAGLGHSFSQPILRKWVAFLYRVATFFSEKVLFLNEEDEKDFKLYNILPAASKKPFLLPGEGVDIIHFSSLVAHSFRKEKEGTFVFIGRLLLDKGIRQFLEAAKKVRSLYPAVKFMVVGEPDFGNPTSISREELDSYIVEGIIEYVGQAGDVRPYLESADALVFPSSYGEGLSRVVLESLAMGVPVIASNNRGCISLVKNLETGLVIPLSQLENLADFLINFLLLSSEERSKMGRNGIRLIRGEYTTEHIISIYKKFIQ